MYKGAIYVPPEKATYEVEVETVANGDFTGVSFQSPRIGQLVNIHSKKGESRQAAISRVRRRHSA